MFSLSVVLLGSCLVAFVAATPAHPHPQFLPKMIDMPKMAEVPKPVEEEGFECYTRQRVSRTCTLPPDNEERPAPLQLACVAIYSPKKGMMGDCWPQQEISLEECKEECIMEKGGIESDFCCCTTKNCNRPERLVFL